MALRTSFRGRILLVVFTAVVAPLVLLGFWLAGAAARSGEALLSQRLDETLSRAAGEIGHRWIRLRADLLDADGAAAAEAPTADGAPLLLVDLPSSRTPDAPGPAREATVSAHQLLGEQARAAVAAGVVLAAFDRRGTSLFALPFDPALLEAYRFRWGGEVWLTRRIELYEPPLLLVATAPLDPFTRPFHAAARNGALLLVLVATGALALAALITRRMTRSLERLSAAAEVISRGELDVRLEPGDDEVGRVAVAFNQMAGSLRHTLRQLADREALAAVGEFAASLAHEVRNPLTSIAVDLQYVAEQLPADSPLRDVQAGALGEVQRLGRTVHDTLAVARSGRIPAAQPLDVHVTLRAAARAVAPELERAGTRLEAPAQGLPPIRVLGDAGALEQVFVNLLRNASQAVGAGGHVRIEVAGAGGVVDVTIRDDGPGIPPHILRHVFEPLVTTKPEGSGLGLAISRRIVAAHGGEIRIDSSPGRGTAVMVRLPAPDSVTTGEWT
jgi:signal transduction histidine kinase